MSWPDPRRPGHPADTTRAWHWVARTEDAARNAMPLGWNAQLGQWMGWDGRMMPPEEVAGRFAYLAPAAMPAEVEAAIARAVAAAVPAGPEEPRGLAGLVASAVPEPPPAMVYRRDAIRNHLLIFAGTLVATLFLVETFGLMR